MLPKSDHNVPTSFKSRPPESSSLHSQEAVPGNHGLVQDMTIVGRGILMGAADVVPGVSGGTVALIVGVYTRLVTALACFDRQLIGHLKARQLGAAARHLDLRFLVALGVGILTGIVALARVINYLLIHHHQLTFAAFYGLILASGILVARRVERWTLGRLLLLLIAVAAAFWFTGAFSPDKGTGGAPVSSGYLFLCGCIGICAMILPGISGSFILLVLGAYGTVIGIVSAITKGELTVENLVALGCFGAGCVVGLLSFSKLLRWLLANFQAATLAVLCGVMLGAVRGVWPFREVSVNAKGHPEFAPNQWPATSEIWAPLAIAIVAAVFVLAMDWITGHWLSARIARSSSPGDVMRDSN